LKKEGLASKVAHNGETALQMVAVESPDMLLVDLYMGGIDGMEV
jgi:DNA-binding response OmpR family regulator